MRHVPTKGIGTHTSIKFAHIIQDQTYSASIQRILQPLSDSRVSSDVKN
ncbi:hypothetical protein CEV34_4163 [Brucella pseudogrignonensis]|uniref:Uncharacterized protein n=1 Tax=Brucella pseudogrignonensis TaxID=419475 RepID=A0A256G7X9_9HYPH|nr:hypothetical protein CEV34_4163 [Brucella pseudogrignonensis]